MNINVRRVSIDNSLDSFINKQQILIVDDEIFNIEALKIYLESNFGIFGVDKICEYAMNGHAALEKVKQNVQSNNGIMCNYHLIFMDQNMPIMDGCDSTLQIRTYLE